MKGRIGRRAVLRGAGVLLGLPLLPSIARGARAPQRFLVMFSQAGTIRDRWLPVGGETDFKLSPILEPLAPHRDQLVVIDGLDLEAARGGPTANNHTRGLCGLLTGHEIVIKPGGIDAAGDVHQGSAGGISVDQEIAQQIGAQTRFRSIELGVQLNRRNSAVNDRISHLGLYQPVPPQGNPYDAFKRLFAQPVGDSAAIERLHAQRRTVLDAVMRDYADLNRTLPPEDRARMDAHLTRVRELETRLGRDLGAGAACRKPDQGAPVVLTSPDSAPAIGRLQMDLLVTALACDLSRVGSLQWASPVTSNSHPWLGITEGHHDLSHAADSDLVARDKLTKINRWYAEQLAYLIAQMKAIREEGGTLMDNATILWCSELGKGNNHSLIDAPFVLAGNAGGAFRMGRLLKYNGTVPHNNLLLSLMHAMGLQATTFGNPRYCTGPLAGLV